jgi:hypothetical protein
MNLSSRSAMNAAACVMAAVVLTLAVGTAEAADKDNRPDTVTPRATVPPRVGAVATTALFAQVAIGGGFTTVFTFMNTGSTPLSGNLILTDNTGNPMNASLTSPGTLPEAGSAGEVMAVGSSVPLSINPGGTQFITASAVNTGAQTVGWARVESDGGTLGGVATFQYSPLGTLQSVAGVLASDATQFATIPVDNDDSKQRYTGFAVANPGSSDLTIRIVPVDANGNVIQAVLLSETLKPGTQLATFLHQEWKSPVALSFKGSVVLIAPEGRSFAVVALVQNQGLYTAIPVIPAKAPTVN